MSELHELQIGSHITFLSGFPFTSEYFDQQEGIQLIRIRDLMESNEKTYYKGTFDARWLIKPGDILIGMDGDFNVVRWQGDEALLNQRILKVEVKPDGLIDQGFFFYWCAPYLEKIHNRTSATTVKHLSVKDIDKAKGLFPKKAIQRRIAEILSTVDEAIKQTEALIAKYQQIKAGLMHDLFTRGVTPDGRLRPTHAEAPHLYKESPLGWIPKEWECLTIGELFTRRAERGKPGLPVMSITMSDGLVQRDSVDRRVESNLLPEDHLLVRQGDIAYNMMRMWQGVLGRAEHDCLVSPAYIVMKPGPNIDSVFAEYLLSEESSIAWFKRLSYGVVDDRLRLYFRDLVRVQLGIPRSLAEQHAISNRLQVLDSSIQQAAMYLVKLRQQKHGLMHDLLTGRVRVQVEQVASHD